MSSHHFPFRTALKYIYTGKVLATTGEYSGDSCSDIWLSLEEQDERDGCTFMCGKVSGKQPAQLDCMFGCFKKFKDLVEFSQMSLISGFQELLFEEWCNIDDKHSCPGTIGSGIFFKLLLPKVFEGLL